MVRRRVAKVKLAVGVPSALGCLFGVLVAFRLAGHPLSGGALWFTLLGIAVVFSGYFALALWQLWRYRF